MLVACSVKFNPLNKIFHPHFSLHRRDFSYFPNSRDMAVTPEEAQRCLSSTLSTLQPQPPCSLVTNSNLGLPQGGSGRVGGKGQVKVGWLWMWCCKELEVRVMSVVTRVTAHGSTH